MFGIGDLVCCIKDFHIPALWPENEIWAKHVNIYPHVGGIYTIRDVIPPAGDVPQHGFLFEEIHNPVATTPWNLEGYPEACFNCLYFREVKKPSIGILTAILTNNPMVKSRDVHLVD